MDISVKIKRIPDGDGNVPDVPAYETTGAAAMDLKYFGKEPVRIGPFERKLLPTGLALEIPDGWVALVFARSGLSVREGLMLPNGVGVIDSDYRGEVKVGLYNAASEPRVIRPGDRIAQMAFFKTPQARLAEVDALSETGRGAGGFGSTGR